MSARTLKLVSPHMKGDDVRAWQETLLNQMAKRWGWTDVPFKVDGDYGVATRTWSGAVLYGLGIPQSAMDEGVTPELRIKVRNRRLTDADRKRYAARAAWRAEQKKKWTGQDVARPLNKVIADTWGYHPPGHDGLDLICPEDAPIYAMVSGTIVRSAAGGWWGANPSGQVSRGDGIIILRCDVNVGPFRKGMNICYGHAEKSVVREGQKVKAGQRLGNAGLAVAWHIHLMVNDNADTRGVGDRDPRPFYDYTRKHG